MRSQRCLSKAGMLYNRGNSLKPISKIDVTAFSCVMAVVILTLLVIEMVAFSYAWGHHGVGIYLRESVIR